VSRDASAADRLAALVSTGLSPRDAVQRVAGELGLPRRKVYNIWLELAASETSG
jgi:hypothetical protein